MPSFQDFVDDALFHPRWGYYATGAVRFGLGGHYDTYPLALSPLFGRMLATQAFRAWRRAGCPARFELCEIGAGNGQLACDVLLSVTEGDRHDEWRRFARAFRYRILERSRALIDRQRATLGPLAARVAWTRADLSRRAPAGAPFAPAGLVFGNEVLDCFAPHRVVVAGDGAPRITIVAARLGRRLLGRAALARALTDDDQRTRVRFRYHLAPLGPPSSNGRLGPTGSNGRLGTTGSHDRLVRFLRRHYPEFFVPGSLHTVYFACPEIEPFFVHMRRLYPVAEAMLIDYGGDRNFHLRTPERRRFFAGPPRSQASLFRAPGRDDITVMVDFSVVQAAAESAGWMIAGYGPQALLARGTGVRLDARAADLIVKTRALGWLLGTLGLDPERAWRTPALGWSSARPGRRSLAATVTRDIAEFLGRRPTPFRLIHLRRGRPASRGAL